MNEVKIFTADVEAKRRSANVCAYGIDLGTTNSCVARASWQPGGKPICDVVNINQSLWPEGAVESPLVPSVIALAGVEDKLVGAGAKKLRARPQDANLMPERDLFYETKNDIGLRKTYHRADEAYGSAAKIAGHLLRYLKESAINGQGKNASINVTVPASFQLNQRRDTLFACKFAGLKLQDDDLLDEPTAALIDYIMSGKAPHSFEPGKTTQCVVFDFGGGTCDVAVMEITVDKRTKQVLMSQVAVSRYHRLGGGDLDTAIVHEVLIPRLLRENSLGPLDLTWAEKKRGLEPQLLGTAEKLKESLCRGINHLRKLHKYDKADKEKVKARCSSVDIYLGKRSFYLSEPTLSAAEWEKILEPFLDRDLLFARQTDYRLTQSVFAPLQDALDRAGRKPEDIDFCLMVGGSSLIPQVRDAVEEYFQKSAVGYFDDPMDIQLSVARGAAWNALYKKLTNRNLIRAVVQEDLALMTRGQALYPLIPARTVLPFPAENEWARVELEIHPQTSIFTDKLLFKIVGATARQTILHEIWDIPEYLEAGREIIMEYNMTAGKQFHCRAFLKDDPEVAFEHHVENPLVNVVNPGSTRLFIEEKEEELRKKGGGTADDVDDFVQLATSYAELNQKERAINWLRSAMNKLGHADATILNLQGNYYGELGDHEREEKLYREADRATTSWGGPLFNLALSFYNRGKYKEATEAIEQAMKKDHRQGPYLTLKAMCLDKSEPQITHKLIYQQAIKAFGAVSTLSEWELGWYLTAVRAVGDAKAIKEAEEERKKRNKKGIPEVYEDAVLPVVKGGLVKRKKAMFDF